MTGASTPLARTLGLGSLVLYGLGTIIGAGIYVLIGEVAAEAGTAMPAAFVAAGVLAGLTGLSYAELVARHPDAGGSAAFVHQAFATPWAARVVGFAVALTGAVAAASITLGGAAYVARIVDLPPVSISASVVVLFTGIACMRVKESVRIAALISVAEIGGLLFVIAAGLPFLDRLPAAGLLPAGGEAWIGLSEGAFVAFFAFIGFEGMANLAEETRDVGRVLPRAILIAIAVSTALYVGISLVALSVVPIDVLSSSPAALASVVERAAPWVLSPFLALATFATLNGVLIELVVLARLGYGMARRGLLPGWFGVVNGITRTPVRTTLAVGFVILALVVAVPFGTLVQLTSGLTLMVFVAVNAALLRLQRTEPPPEHGLRLPRWVPLAGAVSSAGLLAAVVMV